MHYNRSSYAHTTLRTSFAANRTTMSVGLEQRRLNGSRRPFTLQVTYGLYQFHLRFLLFRQARPRIGIGISKLMVRRSRIERHFAHFYYTATRGRSTK